MTSVKTVHITHPIFRMQKWVISNIVAISNTLSNSRMVRHAVFYAPIWIWRVCVISWLRAKWETEVAWWNNKQTHVIVLPRRREMPRSFQDQKELFKSRSEEVTQREYNQTMIFSVLKCCFNLVVLSFKLFFSLLPPSFISLTLKSLSSQEISKFHCSRCFPNPRELLATSKVFGHVSPSNHFHFMSFRKTNV